MKCSIEITLDSDTVSSLKDLGNWLWNHQWEQQRLSQGLRRNTDMNRDIERYRVALEAVLKQVK